MTEAMPPNHSDPLICRQCRGLCCQGHPGVWVEPRRFLDIFQLAQPASPQALARHISDDLVVREIDGVAIPAPRTGPGGCVFLDDSGCRLPEQARPDQCLALVPSLDTLIHGEIHCRLLPTGSTLQAIRHWRQFWAHS
jgi:hypothetical protein